MDVQQMMTFLQKSVGAAYVYGGTGKPCAPAYRRARMKQYPAMASSIRTSCPVLSGKTASCAGCRYLGKPAYDCAQLSRYALKAAGILLPSGATSQWQAQAAWAYRGQISMAAARYVCVLFRRDTDARKMAHVGISLGNGYVVDARGHAVGVIKSKLTAYPWTHMAFPRGFPLPDSLMKTGGEPSAPAQPAPSRPAIDLHALHLAPGDRGESVRLVQTQLTRLGYPLPRFGIDGIYGSETACAVVAFQKVAGLVSSGAADEDTMKALFPRPDPIQAAEASLDDEEHAYSFTL